MISPAVVLLSGGIDSATVLAIARAEGFAACALSFNYGQRHAAELEAASRVATSQRVRHHLVVDVPVALFGGSALTDPEIELPGTCATTVDATYVPARNTVFLSWRWPWAETARRGAHVHRRQRGGQGRLPGLPAGVPGGVPADGRTGDRRRPGGDPCARCRA